jgi:hypothetical protein
MALTKARTSIWSATTLTAAAADTTSSTINLTAGYGSQVNIKLTNGATGPTIAAQVQVRVANDSGATLVTNFGGAFVGGVANNGVYYASIEIPIGVGALILVAGSNTGQNVTVDADISTVTGV